MNTENIYLSALEAGILATAKKNGWGLNEISNWIVSNFPVSPLTADTVAAKIFTKIDTADNRRYILSFKFEGKIERYEWVGLDSSVKYAKFLGDKHGCTVHVYEKDTRKLVKTVKFNG